MLKKFLEKLTGANSAEAATPGELDPSHVAYAALLVEAARGDEVYTATEATLITTMLKRQFDLDDVNAKAVRNAAEEAQREANDLHKFSSVLKSAFSPEEKIEFLEDMWELILSDDDRDPYEDMIMRRLSGLIHVPDAENHAARQRVEARRS